MRRARPVVIAVLLATVALVALVLVMPLLRWTLSAACVLLLVAALVASRRGWRVGATRLAWGFTAALLRAGRGEPREVLAAGVARAPRAPLRERVVLLAGVSRQLVGVARRDVRARRALEAFCRRLSPRARVLLAVLAAAVLVVSVLACALVVTVVLVRAACAVVARGRTWLARACARLEPSLVHPPASGRWYVA